MQVIRFFLFITALFSGTTSAVIYAQEVQTNVRGEKIVVFKDGSWRPYQPADSVLLNKNEEFLVEDSNEDNPFEIPEDTKNKKNAKSSKATKELEAQLNANKKEIEILEKKFYKFSQDPSIPAKDLEAIKNQLDVLIAIETEIKSELAGISTSKQNERKSDNVFAGKKTSESQIGENKLSVTFDSPRSENSIINYTSCEIASSKVDDFSRQKRIELVSNLLFTHTDPKLKPILKTADYLTCQAYLSATDNSKYLNLEMKFLSAAARKEYGAVLQGALLIIRLVNGETINLNSANFDNGLVDPNANTTVYRIQYNLPKNVVKKLLKSEIDKIRMVWSTGYEDYDVYHMRTIMEQLQCLQQIKI